MTRSFGLRLLCFFAALSVLGSSAPAQSSQQLIFAGLRATAGKGQFNAVKTDSAGNLYLLYDQKDGVRILKTDAAASQIYAQAQLGTAGDSGIALALDPSGNVYVTGTTTSGNIVATNGAAFPTRADSSTNSFVAKFDSALNPVFVTYAGSGRMAATAIAVTADAVLITGVIYASTLPVTTSAIIPTPATGSTGNGFVERFDTSGASLIYATYLSGYGGDTSPASIAADTSDNAYIAGYTTATGYPTTSAVVPVMIGASSGFLTKLSANGDSISFSTFIPGDGITSLALDTQAQNLLLSGSIALGRFPIATVSTPLVSTTYQSAARMPLDGSSVVASTLLAPGTQSVVAPASNGEAWATVPLSIPLLPVQSLSSIGTTAAFRINAQITVDQALRLGGAGPGYFAPNIPVTISGITTDSSGSPIFAGKTSPTTSASLLATDTFDLPLLGSSTAPLPSSVRDAILPVGTNCGSLCTGSAAYLAKLSLTAAPALSFSIDKAPNITLRNLGSLAASSLQITAAGFTLSHNCPSQLGPGAECSILLAGTGSGSITAHATNAASQTVTIPAFTRAPTPIVFSPTELDFGIVNDDTTTRTVTVTNLANTAQPVPIYPLASTGITSNPYSVRTDCPNPTLPTAIQPGASCHLTFRANLATTLTTGVYTSAGFATGTSTLLLTAYLEPNDLNLSSTTIEFGTQYTTPGSPRLPRYLYLSNNSSASIQHTHVALPSSSFFTVTDECPSLLEAHSVCRLRIDYLSPQTSSDSVTLSLDQSMSVLVTGKTVPPAGSGGTTVNPSLSVTPTALTFGTSVAVTAVSASSQAVTISNTGVQPFPLATALTGDFTQSSNCPSILAAATSCSVILTFAPSQPGTRQGLLTVTSGAGTQPAYVNLSGTGTAILDANNGKLNVGSAPIGQPTVLWTKISQPFSQLTATTSGDFGILLVEDTGYGHSQPPSSAFTPSATSSCFNCWLGIQFLPAATATRSSILTLASTSAGTPYSLDLTGVGLPLSGLVLSPTQNDFGPIALHSSSAPALFTLTNLTPTVANIATPAITGPFPSSTAPTGGTTCGGALAPNASCYVQVTFAPSSTGPASGTLTISSETATATATLSGYGSADTGLALKPAALVFRNVPGSTSTQQTVTLTNTGIYNLQLATPTSSNPAFTATTTCGALTPSASCTITVTFAPTTASAVGTLSLIATSSGPGAPATAYTIPLSGAYTSEDVGLQILPGQISYGPSPTGGLGLTRQFTINNLTAKLLALSLSLPRNFALTQPACTTLEANGACTFSVSFAPLTNGAITGTISAAGAPSDSSSNVNALAYLEGYGTGTGQLILTGPMTPGSNVVSFGQVASGQSATRTLTLTNSGTTSVAIRRITSESPFLATTTCANALAVSATCTITLTYSPLNQISAGAAAAPFASDTGTVVIESDAASSPDFVDLSGTVTPAAVAAPSNIASLATYALSEGSLTFTATAGGTASVPHTISLTNTGGATIHIAAVTSTPDFAVSSTCGTVVAGASCPITVTFTPQAGSSQTATNVVSALEISSDANTPLNFISLLGTATPSSLVLSPASLDFASILVGSSATLPIGVTNASTTTAILGAIAISGDYSLTSDCPAAGSQLAVGASCTLQVTFQPTASGTRQGSLSIASSLTTLPLNVNLTGTGAQARLQSTPTALNFPATLIGSSAQLTLSLANTGNAPVTDIKAAATGDYAIATSCSSTTLAPGASCAISIRFSPTATGSRTGSLTIASSDPTSPLTIPLNGDGTASPSILLSVNGGTSASATVVSGTPASYNLTLVPQNGYTGAVVLNCTPVNPGQYATCSLLPSSMTVNGTAALTSVATINTITTVTTASRSRLPGSAVLCLLPLIFLLPRRAPRVVLACLLSLVAAIPLSGCGSGGSLTPAASTNIRYTPPGTYQYQVTASSTTGVQISQTVTLNLTVTPRQ